MLRLTRSVIGQDLGIDVDDIVVLPGGEMQKSDGSDGIVFSTRKLLKGLKEAHEAYGENVPASCDGTYKISIGGWTLIIFGTTYVVKSNRGVVVNRLRPLSFGLVPTESQARAPMSPIPETQVDAQRSFPDTRPIIVWTKNVLSGTLSPPRVESPRPTPADDVREGVSVHCQGRRGDVQRQARCAGDGVRQVLAGPERCTRGIRAGCEADPVLAAHLARGASCPAATTAPLQEIRAIPVKASML